MRRFSILAFFMAFVSSFAFGWGQKGHDIVAEIAGRHLTPAARHAVDSILGGRSMVYWANWLDNASHTPEYAYSKTWHYKNVDEGDTYESALANPAGDAVTAIKAQIETLSDHSAPIEKSGLAMKMLIHIVGDLHQPMHMGHASDLGANRIKVKYFGRDVNLHSVWDGSILAGGHAWSYSEWADQLDRVTPEEEALIADGSVDDWARETLPIAAEIYRSFPQGTNISYNEVFEWTPVVEQQLLRGGLRLARILNALFDPSLAGTGPYRPQDH
ncbi:MAG: S1/P1 nuclease [Paramuribaculum sp.]|nr:S1/P1 nuclease [Paramuribaculum sp.]MDE6488221.1 S1/P1 nuclease [Paramuribaculum sp.]